VNNMTSVHISHLDDPIQCREVLLSAALRSFGKISPQIIPHIRDTVGFNARQNSRITASINNRIVGFVDWRANEIKWLMVASGFDRKGIGTNLLNVAATRMPPVIEVICVGSNVMALSFYKKNGFGIVCNNVEGKMFGVQFRNVRLRRPPSSRHE
jgi:GNAT superfamily N-acetyltransferase